LFKPFLAFDFFLSEGYYAWRHILSQYPLIIANPREFSVCMQTASHAQKNDKNKYRIEDSEITILRTIREKKLRNDLRDNVIQHSSDQKVEHRDTNASENTTEYILSFRLSIHRCYFSFVDFSEERQSLQESSPH
jgi:hypothetical protein